MKKFNKLRFLQWLGLFRYRFDFEKLEFQEAWQYRVRAALLTSLFSTFGLKIYLTKFWPNYDPKQLLIGSVFNYLDPLPKQFMVGPDRGYSLNVQLKFSDQKQWLQAEHAWKSN